MTENLTDLLGRVHFSGDSKAYTLLKQIDKKLGSTFLSDSVRKEANESRRQYVESLQTYFKYRIIMDAVVKTSYSQNNQEENIPSFYLNAIPKYAPQCEPSLPFSCEHVSNILKNKRIPKSDIEKYSTMVEIKIAEFCIKLCEYTGRIGTTRDWRKTFSKTLQYISSKADHLDLEVSKIRPQKLALQEMLCTYYTELSEGLTILKRILNLFEKKFNFQLDLAEMFYLDSQCLLLKIRIFEWRLMDLTYTNESLPALRLIRDGLNTRGENSVNDRDKTQSALEAYEALGSEYVALAETYRQLTERISQQKWAISTLASRTSS